MLTGKPIANRLSGRPKRTWGDNIRLELRGINTRNSDDSTQDKGYWRPLVNAALNLRV